MLSTRSNHLFTAFGHFMAIFAMLFLFQGRAAAQNSPEPYTPPSSEEFYESSLHEKPTQKKSKKPLDIAAQCDSCEAMALRKQDAGKNLALSDLLFKGFASLFLSWFFVRTLCKPNTLFSLVNTKWPRTYALLVGGVLAVFFVTLLIFKYFNQLDIAGYEYAMDLTKCPCD